MAAVWVHRGEVGKVAVGLRGDKKRAGQLAVVRLLGGSDLLSHFRSTIGAVRFNFSVRNGKRWNPHAITTLVSFFCSALAAWLLPVWLLCLFGLGCLAAVASPGGLGFAFHRSVCGVIR